MAMIPNDLTYFEYNLREKTFENCKRSYDITHPEELGITHPEELGSGGFYYYVQSSHGLTEDVITQEFTTNRPLSFVIMVKSFY